MPKRKLRKKSNGEEIQVDVGSNQEGEEEENGNIQIQMHKDIPVKNIGHYTWEFLCEKEEILKAFMNNLDFKKNIKIHTLEKGIQNDAVLGKYKVTIRFKTSFKRNRGLKYLKQYPEIELND